MFGAACHAQRCGTARVHPITVRVSCNVVFDPCTATAVRASKISRVSCTTLDRLDSDATMTSIDYEDALPCKWARDHVRDLHIIPACSMRPESIKQVHVFITHSSHLSSFSNGSSHHAERRSPAAWERQRGVHFLWQCPPIPSPPGCSSHDPSLHPPNFPDLFRPSAGRKACSWTAFPARTLTTHIVDPRTLASCHMSESH